jgi:hypothetical protein
MRSWLASFASCGWCCVLERPDGAIRGTLYAIRNAHLESSLLFNSVALNLLVFIRVDVWILFSLQYRPPHILVRLDGDVNEMHFCTYQGCEITHN